MKKLFTLLTIFLVFITQTIQAQCPGGTTAAGINWDLQTFRIVPPSGTNFVFGINSMSLTYTGTLTGVNATNTAAGTSYGGGNDINFTPGNNTVTLTFLNEVQNVRFAVHDIDNAHTLAVSATNAASVAQNVTLTKISGTVITLGGTATIPTATSINTAVLNSSTDGTVNVDIAGPVKTITLTFTKTTGTDAIWVTDISACVTGDYQSNYQAISAPETGQPTYLSGSWTNNLYVVNTTTNVASLIYTDAALTSINSLAYDPYNQIFYYCDGTAAATNRSIYKYDVKNCTRSTFITDITVAPFNVQLSSGGLGAGGASFYNGSLFIGADHNLTGNEFASIWRIDIDNNGTAIRASRLWGQLAVNAGVTQTYFDWADFVMNNGTLYNFNASVTPAANTQIQHISLNTQTAITGFNETTRSQAAIDYNGNIYNLKAGPAYALYNNAGGFGADVAITGVTGGPADASESFKFPYDFGDAPASYGSVYHLYSCAKTLRLGAAIDFEINDINNAAATGDNTSNYTGSGTTNDEDGITTFPNISIASTSYSVNVAVTNTSGASATLYGYIDFNADGDFADAGEISAAVTVANGATSATVNWTGLSGLVAGTTYARFRLAASATESGNATGFAATGEVEDYTLIVNVSISGNVLNDVGGLVADANVNGTGLGIATGTQLYVNLLDGSGNVVASVAVNPDGSYTFPFASPNTSYTIQLSTNQGTIGNPAPATALPANWVNTGEDCCDNSGSDGTPDGIVAVTTALLNINNANFGIEQLPQTNNQNYTITPPPVNSYLTLNGTGASNSPGPLSGSDPEDGILGSGNTFIITQVPANAELYYDFGAGPVLLTNNTVIANYDPSKLQVRFTTVGSTVIAFNYASVDAAGKQDATPATFTINLSAPLPILLTSFNGIVKNCDVILLWVTAQEINSDRFMVQQSGDGINFTTALEVKTTGNSNGSSYQASIAQSNGLNYYRLKMQDKDGAFTYSEIISVKNNCQGTDYMYVYPNPVKLNTTLSFQTAYRGNAVIVITNAAGQQISNSKISVLKPNYVLNIGMQNYAAGIYLVYLTDAKGTKISGVQKVIKE